MWYSPVHLKFCRQVALHENKPHESWVEFTEDLRDKYPDKTFYVETRTEQQLKESCEMLKGAIDVIKQLNRQSQSADGQIFGITKPKKQK